MTTIYFADFVGKKLLRKEEVGESKEEIPEMPEQDVLDKLSYFAELVGTAGTTVKANTTMSKVVVPDSMKNLLKATFNFSHNFKPNDLKYDELGVSQSLSFKGQPFKVKIPWEAVRYIGWTHGGKARNWENAKPPVSLNFPNTNKVEEDKPDPEPPRTV